MTDMTGFARFLVHKTKKESAKKLKYFLNVKIFLRFLNILYQNKCKGLSV